LLALLFNESLDEFFAPTPLALGPLAQVAIPASLTCGVAVVVGRAARRGHLPITVRSPCREFIAEDCVTCSVLIRDLFARRTTQAEAERLAILQGFQPVSRRHYLPATTRKRRGAMAGNRLTLTIGLGQGLSFRSHPSASSVVTGTPLAEGCPTRSLGLDGETSHAARAQRTFLVNGGVALSRTRLSTPVAFDARGRQRPLRPLAPGGPERDLGHPPGPRWLELLPGRTDTTPGARPARVGIRTNNQTMPNAKSWSPGLRMGGTYVASNRCEGLLVARRA